MIVMRVKGFASLSVVTLTYDGFSHPSPVPFPRPVHDATTHIEETIFSIATYLNLSSQARGMTGAGRGVAWKSWNLRGDRAKAILFSITTYLDWSSQARIMTEAGRGVAVIGCCQ